MPTSAANYLARNLTNDEYNALLAEVVRDHTGARPEILDIPGVYEALASHFEYTMMARHIASTWKRNHERVMQSLESPVQ